MAAPPQLLSVSRALPPRILAISHIPQLVNDFLLPSTIDAAVYCDLKRVLQVYGTTRPWTVKAMDGAAARGRLDILQWLYYNRTEGCSTSAFTGAAASGHLKVIEWLSSRYPSLDDPLQCLTAAAGAGKLNLVKYQRSRVDTYEIMAALDAAAANGHTKVLEALLPWPNLLISPFELAVANGHVEAVQLLVKRGCSDSILFANPALKIAAKAGYYDVVKVLLPKCDLVGASDALLPAAEYGLTNVVKLLLTTHQFEQVPVALALVKSTENDHCDVVKLLVNYFADDDVIFNCDSTEHKSFLLDRVSSSIADDVLMLQRFVGWACYSAVGRGSVEMVKILAGKCPTETLGRALQRVTTEGNHDVVAVLLKECERRHLELFWYNSHVGQPFQNAAFSGDLEMVKLLVAKCDPPSAGRALKAAVLANHLDVLKLLAPITGVYSKEDPYKVDALVSAATVDRIAMLEVLLKYCDQRTIEESLLRLASKRYITATKFLLKYSDSVSSKHIFVRAAEKGIVELVKILLEKMDTSNIRWALMTASASGYLETVKSMLDKCDTVSIGCALEAAVLKRELAVIEVLRERCEPTSISDAIASAKVNAYTDVVELLDCKRRRLA